MCSQVDYTGDTYLLSLWLEIDLSITEMELLGRFTLHIALASFAILEVFL